MSEKLAIVLDVDGTIEAPALWSGAKTPRPEILGRTLNELRQAGYLTAVGTGAGRNRVIKLEREIDHDFDLVGHSYCAGLEERNGHVTHSFLAPQAERVTLWAIMEDLRKVAIAHKGEVTDAEHEGGCFSFHVRRGSFTSACEQVLPLLEGKSHLRFRPTTHDCGVVVTAASAGKKLLVDHLRHQGYKIAVAAGDTEGDLDLIQAVIEDEGWPIITRTEASEPVNKELASVVRNYGRGYLAQELEAHGYGLLAGLKAARDNGAISF